VFKTILILFLAFICIKSIIAQNYNFKHYTIEDGLLHEFVNDIIQDSKGNVWLATGGGLSKFNGVEFSNYTSKFGLNYSRLLSLSEDHSGNIWIGSSQGINVFNGDIFLSCQDSQLGKTVLALEKANNNLMWILTDSGLNIATLVNNKIKFKHLPYNLGYKNEISIFQQRDLNNFVLQTKNIGTFIGYGGTLFWFHNKKMNKILMPDSIQVFSACELDNNEILIGTNKGFFLFNNLSLKPFRNNFTHNASILKIKVSKFKIWAIAKWKGESESYLICIKLSNPDYFRKIGKKNGLINDPTSIFIDHENNVWCSSYGGLSILRGESFINYHTKNGMIGNKIWGVTEDSEHRIWAGTIGEGLSIISKDTIIERFGLKEGLPDLFVGKIFELNKNKMLIGTAKHGLCMANFNPKKKTWLFEQLKIKLNQGDTRIDDITKDHNDTIWIASSKGLYFCLPNKIDPVHYPLFEGDTGQVFVQKLLFSSKKELWVTTRNKGVFVKRNGKFHSILETLLNNKIIASICEDCFRNIWIASQTDGVMNISTKNPVWLNESHGLSSKLVYFLQADNHCNLWIGTNLGLDKMILYPYNKNHQIVIRHYDTDDGLQTLEMNLNGSIMDHHDNLWFASNNGLLKYSYNEDIINSVPPITHITDIKLFSKKTNWNKYHFKTTSWYHIPKNLKLSYKNNHITFEFVGISYKNPKKVTYSWILEGFDKKWNPPTSSRQAIYSNLEPGKYTFKLKASNDEGLWTKNEIVYSFEIIPPFWTTWWFRLIITILFIFSLYYAYRIRTLSLRKKHIELEKQVKERTTEILKQKEKIEEIYHVLNQSIEYAKNIQKAILPDEKTLSKYFSDYFVLFMPRDKVSGDFYWWTYMKHENIIVLTVADCTGHGVPGAFMSMLGITMLNEIVNKEFITYPAVILRRLRKDIVKTLRQSTEVGELKDGMDMAVVSINLESLLLQYAGANNPVYIIRPISPNSNEFNLFELKPDKMPISIYDKMDKFTPQEFQLNKGDRIFVFSDGFADQFGGNKGKKLMYKNFKQLLMNTSSLRMNQQHESLITFLNEWKKNYDQIDDITVVGIEIN